VNRRLFWIYALSSSVYFTQGIEGLPSQGLFYYLKETLGFSPEKIMVIGSFTTSAWLVKPVIGYIIDNFFNKRAWVFISLTFDIITVIVIGSISLPIAFLVGLLIFNSANTAFRDVAVDGIMCVEGKKDNTTGKIQSIQWTAISVSGLITGIAGGYIAQVSGYKLAFLCLVPIYILVGVAAAFYTETDRMKMGRPETHLAADMKKLFAHKQLLIIGLFIFPLSARRYSSYKETNSSGARYG
jgi:MFS family permease